MKILFLVYHGFSDTSGISKKIHNQVKGLRENGHEVHLCHYSLSPEGHWCRYVDERVVCDYGTDALASVRRRFDYRAVYKYCVGSGIELVYARSFMNASPMLIRFFRRLRAAGIKAVTEIPTYPYDGELKGFPARVRAELMIDKLFRRRLARQMDAIVTFSEEKEIFGCRTINISNGVDLDSIPIHDYHAPADGSVHLVGVAEVHYWHGFDRLIAGIGEYRASAGNNWEVYFHIVGGVADSEMHTSPHAPGFAELIERYGISKYVVFHGAIYGEALDAVFNRCVFAVGSLGRHRSGITSIKTLKNREYATRGIPFIYSEQDSDFDDRRYVLKAPADETPVDIRRILDFIDHNDMRPQDIRASVAHLTWKKQMQAVVDSVRKARE